MGNHTAAQNIALEDFSVAGQGVNAFLDTGTAGIVQADAGGAVTQGHVLDLADFLAHGLGQGTARNREILGKYVYQAAADGTATGNHAVSVGMGLLHPEVGAAVPDKHVVLLEAAGIQQEFQALSRRLFAFCMLGFDALFATAQAGFGAPFYQLLDVFTLNTHICYLNILSTSFTASGRANTATRS